MKRILRQKFFNRPAPEVSRDLLGKVLVRRKGKVKLEFTITEVEAYEGFKDKGSHAHRGMTKRNFPMFGPAGVWYVYFTYGMHWMLNIVTGEKGFPSAVLIRGVSGIKGPGRVARALGVDRNLSGRKAVPPNGLWIEDRGVVIPENKIKRGPRIGIDYAGPFWRKRHWRFYIKD